MSLPVKTGFPLDLDIPASYTVRFTATNPTTGALVSGVNVSLATLLVAEGATAATIQDSLDVGPFMLVPGPDDAALLGDLGIPADAFALAADVATTATTDAGTTDAGTTDAGATDAGTTDGGGPAPTDTTTPPPPPSETAPAAPSPPGPPPPAAQPATPLPHPGTAVPQ